MERQALRRQHLHSRVKTGRNTKTDVGSLLDIRMRIILLLSLLLLLLLSLLLLSLLSLLLSLAIIGFIKKTKETYINTYTYDNSLVYLYMNNCPRCDKFKKTWDEIIKKTELLRSIHKYEFNVNSFDINDEDKGTKIATEKGYTYAPVILFITPKGTNEYMNEGEMNADKILDWCIKINKCSIK